MTIKILVVVFAYSLKKVTLFVDYPSPSWYNYVNLKKEFSQKETAMLYQAHRGVQKEYPENTMSAFKAAMEQGYGIIETDPSVTQDDVFVVMHDDTINRTARNAYGKAPEKAINPGDITFAEANEYEYGSWFAPEFKGEKLRLFNLARTPFISKNHSFIL